MSSLMVSVHDHLAHSYYKPGNSCGEVQKLKVVYPPGISFIETTDDVDDDIRTSAHSPEYWRSSRNKLKKHPDRRKYEY